MSDPPRRFVDSELLLRRPECREKGGRFFFVRCVGGFRVSGRGFSRGGAAGSGVCGLTVLHCAAKLVRQDSGATGRPATSCIRRRRRLSGSRRAAMAVAGGPEPAFDAVRWSRNVRSRGSGSLPAFGGGVEPVRMRRDFPTAILRKGRIRSPSDSFFRFIFITWLLLLFLSLAMFRHLNRATNGQKIG